MKESLCDEVKKTQDIEHVDFFKNFLGFGPWTELL